MRRSATRSVSQAVGIRLAWLGVGIGTGFLLAPLISPQHRRSRWQDEREPVPSPLRGDRRTIGAGAREGDEDLKARVYDALPSWRGVCAIETRAGQVVLRGEVSRVEDIAAVEVDVRNVAGVDEVVNLMHLENAPG